MVEIRIDDQRIKRQGKQSRYTVDFIGSLYPALHNEDGIVRMDPIKIEFNPSNGMKELRINEW